MYCDVFYVKRRQHRDERANPRSSSCLAPSEEGRTRQVGETGLRHQMTKASAYPCRPMTLESCPSPRGAAFAKNAGMM